MKLFRNLFTHPITAARGKLERAQMTHAKHVGEAGYAESMVMFYGTLLKGIDPHTDWWRFADVKQKHFDAIEERDFAQQNAEEAFAKASARMDELVRLEGGQA